MWYFSHVKVLQKHFHLNHEIHKFWTPLAKSDWDSDNDIKMLIFTIYCMYDYMKGYIKHLLLVTVSFIIPPHSIFSLDVPKEQRLQAVRAAILLMPDENREVLQTLLYFLRDVTSLVEENQMTPMNLAVCLGPSLFHLSILKNETLSPRCIYELVNMLMLT